MLSGTLLTLLLALSIDALIGYPNWVFRALGHPVTWIGALISALDRSLNREDRTGRWRRLAGIFAFVCIVGSAAGTAFLIQKALDGFRLGWIVTAFLASSLIASRSLYEHVSDVAGALQMKGLEAGRQAVSRIVGRDPNTLDEHGVARAAIESLAENASDGVVAPAFWFALLGLPGLAAYKAINTADSMIGHRTPKHQAFGWASARADDVMNIPASRLSAMLIAFASIFTKASPGGAINSIVRDARRHRSPNAGWPEAAMAGALGLRLAGPRVYGGVRVEDAIMGDGCAEATVNDIRRALLLATIAWGVMFTLIAVLGAVLLPGRF